jgi:hypothetical protein
MQILLLLTMLAAQTPQAPLAPWLGVWRLNVPQSSVDRELPYKRGTCKIEPWEDGLKVTYDFVGTRGGVTHMEWMGKFDGKDYRVQGVDYILTNAYSQITDRAYQIAVKVDGVLTATTKVAISPDGKTLTAVTTQKNARGETVNTTMVYEK